MTRVNIYGIIYADDVPEWADAEIQAAIDRGLVTIAGRVCRQIQAAEDDIELNVNSYGGEVFGAQAISAALCDWARAHQDKSITVTVGALAASAAANLLVSLPPCAKVIGHDETLVMYHSAYSLCMGGAGAMRDEAALIDRVNGRVQRALKAKTRFSPTLIDGWFAEGRCGWIDGWEAWDAGLFQELANEPAGAMPEKASAGDGGDAAIRQMAAFANSILGNIKQKQEEAVMADKKKNPLAEEETPAVEPEKEEKVQPAEAPAQEGEENKEQAPEPAPAPAEQEGEENKPPCGEGEEEEKAEAEDDEKKKDEEIAALRKEIAEIKKTLAKLTAGLKVKQTDERPKQTFKEAVAELNAKNLHGSAYDKAYAEIMRQF